MSFASISALWRYPVKSMAGERIPSCALGALGVPGDRGWAVRDEVRGGIRGAKKIPALMRCAASYGDQDPEAGGAAPRITLPDGSVVRADEPDASARLSAALGTPVTLWPRRPAEELDHYRRGQPDHEDLEIELREIFGRRPDEPLPDLSAFPPEIFEYESPPGTYFDAFPLLLLTDASLARLQALVPGSRVDVRRFRPNLQIAMADGDAAGEGYPEATWAGRRLAVGGAVLELTVPCPRCVMITHGFDDLPKDPAILRAVVREAEQNLGIYAKVVTPGAVAVGDELRWL